MSAARAGDDRGQPLAGGALLLGGLLLALYAAAVLGWPRAPGEFTNSPSLEPLPFAPMRGFTFEQLGLHLLRLAYLAPALALLSLAAARFVPRATLVPAPTRRLAWSAIALSVAVSAAVLFGVLRGQALVDDELTLRDQAVLLGQGRIGADPVPGWQGEPFTIASRAGLTGKYLFGEPVVQILGARLGYPGLLHLPLAALALVAWWRVATFFAGAEVGAWSVVWLALSPLWMLTTATGLAHTTSLACVVLAGLGLVWCLEGHAWRGALLAGMALGALGTVRPQVAVPFGGVLALAVARGLWRRAARLPLLAFGGCLAAWIALVAGYDARVTGAATTLPWALYPGRETLGFAAPHSVLGALENLLVTLVRWNGWWLGLPLGLAVVVVWDAVGRPRAGLRPWLAGGLTLVLTNFLYYSPGVSDTGPVYYFELLLPAALLAAHTTVAALARWPRYAAACLVVHVALGTGSFVLEQAARLARLRSAIHARVDAVLAGLERPALLFHETAADEHRTSGWVFSFPVRQRAAWDPIVTYPRHSGEEVRALRARWPDRRCYYYRSNPRTGADEVLDCDAARDLLERPYDPARQGLGRMPPPTAQRLGLLDAPLAVRR